LVTEVSKLYLPDTTRLKDLFKRQFDVLDKDIIEMMDSKDSGREKLSDYDILAISPVRCIGLAKIILAIFLQMKK